MPDCLQRCIKFPQRLNWSDSDASCNFCNSRFLQTSSQANLKSCQGMNLFKMLDERTKHPVYQENMQAANTRVGLSIFVRILFPTCCVIPPARPPCERAAAACCTKPCCREVKSCSFFAHSHFTGKMKTSPNK